MSASDKDEVSKEDKPNKGMSSDARWNFFTVLVGTTFVGVVTAVFTFLINYWGVFAKETTDQRAFLHQYIDNALDQDIELRLRFSHYFKHLGDSSTVEGWKEYHKELLAKRKEIQDSINTKDGLRIKIEVIPEKDRTLEQKIALSRLYRELKWASNELVFAQRVVNSTAGAAEDDKQENTMSKTVDDEYYKDFESFIQKQNLKYYKPEEFLVLGGSNVNPSSPCLGLNHPPPRELWPNIVPLAKAIDAARDRGKGRIRIVSAFRSVAYSKCIHAAPRSRHITFEALDITSDDMSADDLAKLMRTIREEKLFQGGIGKHAASVHIDSRAVNADW